jgi:hypothetical protein
MGIPKGKETVGFVPLRLEAQIREGERTATKPRRFGILVATSPHGSVSAWHVRLPLAPLLSALGSGRLARC